MSVAIPRLRMFAGPNGSGKSTIKEVIEPQLLGVYINPDEIEKDIRRFDFLDFSTYHVVTTTEEVLPFFQQSALLTQAGFADKVAELRFSDGKLSFYAVPVNAYFASVAADFIRQKLLDAWITFTFETVMSSPDKVAVPHDKIIARYYRSLDFLADAVRYSDRAYIFDNSFHAKVWLAEVTDGNLLEMKSDTMPHWFKTALWDKFFPITDESAS